MRKLIAKCPILYHSHTYQEGETLPTDNIDNIKLWIKNEVAMWEHVVGASHEGSENDDAEDVENEKVGKDCLEREKGTVSETDTVKSGEQEVKEATTQKVASKPTTRNTTSKTKMPTGRNSKK